MSTRCVVILCVLSVRLVVEAQLSRRIHFDKEAPLAVGDPCTQEYDGAAGVCLLLKRCASAQKTLLDRKPTTCGYLGMDPIVCCVELLSIPTGSPNFDSDPPLRMSERKCDEYTDKYTVYESALFGGTTTKTGEYPHIAALGWTSSDGVKWQCGGSLISERYVLTAAHCANSPKGPPDVVRLGEQNIKSANDGAKPVDIPVEGVTPHPGYKRSSKYDDIALIKLQKRPDLGKSIKPICLWAQDDFRVQEAVATGWGVVGFAEQPSDELLKVTLNIIARDTCVALYEGVRSLKSGIIDTQLCAGNLETGADTCQGDSGGPLQITRPDVAGKEFLIGVTSFGKGCGSPNTAGVYTRVSKYVDWIESIVWKTDQ